MADPDLRRTIFEAIPLAGDEALTDPAPDWLRGMLRDAGLPVSEAPSVAADRLTAQSQSFARDARAGQDTDPSNASAAARLAPAARTMLGWSREAPDPDDRFAARLMAAFQSGALDVKPSGVLPHPALAADVTRNSRTPADTPKRDAARGATFSRPDLKHQKYPAGAVVGRSIYAPW